MRPDAYPAEVDDGAYILTHQRPVRLAGASIARWIDRIAPHLDGSRTLAELTAALDPQRREMVEKVVTALRDTGVVRAVNAGVDTARPAAMSAAELREYGPEIGYVDYFRDGAAAAVARYTGCTALVVGSGPLLPALAFAGLRSGLRRVRVAVTDEQDTDLDELRRAGASMGRRDPGQALDLAGRFPPDPREEALAALLHDVGLVLHAAVGERGEARARLLDQGCARAGVMLAQVVLDGDDAWLVPARMRGRQPGRQLDRWPGWAAAARRREAGSRLVAAETGGANRGSEVRGAPAASTDVILACQLVHDAFRAVAGVEPSAGRAHVTRVGLHSLRSEDHAFLPHPFALPATAATEREFRNRIGELERAGGQTEESFSRLAAACVDDRLGLFTFTDTDWAQVPLLVSEAVVSDPVGLVGDDPRPPTVFGAGFTYRNSRCRAALRALARYGAMMVDPRRLLDTGARKLIGPADDPTAALEALRTGTMTATTWGWRLDAPARPRLVPATTAFPALRAATQPADASCGIAAGYGWQEAVEAGLLGHCRRLTLAELTRARDPYPRVDLAAQALDGTGTRCRNLLADLGDLPEVYDVTGSLGVPTFAFCLGRTTLAYSAGTNAPAALADGLMQVVLTVQANTYGQLDILPPAPADLPVALRGSGIGASAWPTLSPRTVAVRLRRTGRVALAVPLDHDPALYEISPFVVNVVICDD